MMSSAWKLPLAAAVLAASMVPAAHAAFSSLVVFGDSLSDNGNAAALTGNNFPPSAFYYPGRFSNGPVAPEYLATALGATLYDHAVGGATTGTANYNFAVNRPDYLFNFPALATTGMANQVANFNPAGYDMQHTLFMLWGGPNDIFLEIGLPTAGGMAGAIGSAMSNLAGQVGALAAQGATHFLVPGMTDLGQTPEAVAAGADTQAALTYISGQFNGALAGTLALVKASLPGANIYGFDTASFLNGKIAGSPGNGFTQVTKACLFEGAAPACEGYLFYDNVHPTTAGHAQLGAAFAAAVPEPATYAMLLVGLAVIGGLLRRRATEV